jgi:hypothetical protein
MKRVSFDQAAEGGLLVRVYVRHGRINLSLDYPNEQLPKPKRSQVTRSIFGGPTCLGACIGDGFLWFLRASSHRSQ